MQGAITMAHILLCLHEVAKNVGVNLIRYDFSEPQAGKDICDRKTAPMKAHIRRFVNENNDVTTAEEMNKALESHGGLRGCRVAVVEIDPSKDLHEANKIPDISLLSRHEIHNLRIFNLSVKNRKYKASSLRTSSAFRKDA